MRSSVKSSHIVVAAVAVSLTLALTEGAGALVPHIFLLAINMAFTLGVLLWVRARRRAARVGEQLMNQVLVDLTATRGEIAQARAEIMRLLRQTFCGVSAMTGLQRQGIATMVDREDMSPTAPHPIHLRSIQPN